MDLVSVIIPCYNAAHWVSEAVDSCLRQTYAPIEIIVVDDGSTDNSIDVLRGYGDRIHLVQRTNAGGSQARNHGFALSQGKFIQFLDADDYILPIKIACQIAFLQETGADVVYGDWRHEYCNEGSTCGLGPVNIPGTQEDVLAALLGGWWTANLTLLFRRAVVEQTGGWDESLAAGQDRDFFQSVALTGADIRYQPGCHSIYRRYGAVTVSTSNRLRWLENHQRILEKAEARLLQMNKMTAIYRQALARSYFHVARNYYQHDRTQYAALISKTLALDPGFAPQESTLYNAVYRMLGFEWAERMALFKHRLYP